MTAKVDHYRTLRLRHDASEEEIRQSYFRLVRTHHPDLNLEDPQAIDRFKEIQHAYEVLANRTRRLQHDRELGKPLSVGPDRKPAAEAGPVAAPPAATRDAQYWPIREAAQRFSRTLVAASAIGVASALVAWSMYFVWTTNPYRAGRNNSRVAENLAAGLPMGQQWDDHGSGQSELPEGAAAVDAEQGGERPGPGDSQESPSEQPNEETPSGKGGQNWDWGYGDELTEVLKNGPSWIEPDANAVHQVGELRPTESSEQPKAPVPPIQRARSRPPSRGPQSERFDYGRRQSTMPTQKDGNAPTPLLSHHKAPVTLRIHFPHMNWPLTDAGGAEEDFDDTQSNPDDGHGSRMSDAHWAQRYAQYGAVGPYGAKLGSPYTDRFVERAQWSQEINDYDDEDGRFDAPAHGFGRTGRGVMQRRFPNGAMNFRSRDFESGSTEPRRLSDAPLLDAEPSPPYFPGAY